MGERLLKESDVLRIAFQLPLVVNSAFADAVKALPSADRPTGEWLCSDDSYENAVCSNCGFDSGESYAVVKYEQKWKACPMCEARMRGEYSEND